MNRRRGLPLAALAVVLLAAAGAGLSSALFTDSTENPGNRFGAASAFPGTRVATGTYTGNAVDNRSITGVGFAPDVVIVKAATADIGVISTATMLGDTSKPLNGATALVANRIQSLTANGFTIGTDVTVNRNATVYYWTALKTSAASSVVGTYSGSGSAKSIDTVGFQPHFVAVFSAGAHIAVERFAGMSRTYAYGSNTGVTTGVTGFSSSGFSVGTDAAVNANGTTYHYLALTSNGNNVWAGSFAGNGADNRNITGPGFEPIHVNLRADSSGTARRGIHRPAALPGDSAQSYTATANAANLIQSLTTTGFQVGTDANVNASGTTYYALALKDLP